MLKYSRSLIFMALLLANVAMASLAFAYATEPVQIDPSRQDFVVGPGKTDLTLTPGESTVVELMVSNRTGVDRNFEIKFEDFVGSQDLSSPVVFTNEKGATTMADYLSVPEKTFFLKNGERARIPVTITVPAGAEAGGRYASVLISTLVPVEKTAINGDERKGGVPLITQTGTLVFVTIPGNVKKEGALTEFFTQNKKSFFSVPKDVVFSLIFSNTGKIHLKPSGTISVKNIFGQEIKNIEVTPWFAMPNSLRLREVNLIADPVKEKPFMLGRYVAEAKIFRDYDNLTDTKSFAFWIIPWKLLLVIFLILLVIVFLISLGVKYVSSHFEFKAKPTEVKPTEVVPPQTS